MRQPWGLLVALILVSVSLAGCLGSSPDGSSDQSRADTGSDDRIDRLEASGCREQIGIFGMDAATVSPYMPEGFEPMPVLPPEVYQGADPSEQTATLLLVGFVCDQPPMTLFLPLVPVMPPEELREPEVYYHAVALPCIADGATATVLEAWGAPCQTGTTAIEPQVELPAGAVWDLAAESSTFTVTMQGSAPASETPAGPEWVRLFHALDGQLCSVSDTRVEVHEHWQFGSAMVTAEGSAGFPVPDQPGMGSLGMPGFALDLTRVQDGGTGGPAGSVSCV